MHLSLFIARRYLFSKKSHNAVNVISAISVVGIAVATLAMVCVLSGFNGFRGLLENTLNSFDPDLKITVKQGKVFDYHTSSFDRALSLPEIALISETLEENALCSYGGRQLPVTLKGVSEEFRYMSQMDKLLIDGVFALEKDTIQFITIGSGMAVNLGVRPKAGTFLELYAPKRKAQVNLANPASAFMGALVEISGVFSLNQPKYDDAMAIIPIRLARGLFEYPTEITSLDVKLKNPDATDAVQRKIEAILGDDFSVENRYQQQRESYNMLQIEKWVSFLILSLILLIAIFNVVGSLSMLIVEKQEDIKSLRNMGASDRWIARVFMYEGWLISFLGVAIGLGLGVALCLLQQHFGFLKFGDTPGTYVVDAYPVKVMASDIAVIFGVVCSICMLTVLYPVSNLKRKLKSL